MQNPFKNPKPKLIFIKKSAMRAEDAKRLTDLTGDVVVLVDELTDIQVVDEDRVVKADTVKVQGEFMPDMTEAEILAYERNERQGWKNFKLPWQHDS